MLPGEPNPFWFIWIPLLILRSCSHLKRVYTNENRWPFCSRSSSLHFWFIIFNWYICFWAPAPKLQLTLCQCCFHFALRCTASESVSCDLKKNPSWSLFPSCPGVFDGIYFLLAVFIVTFFPPVRCLWVLSLCSCQFFFFFTHNNWPTSVVLLKPTKPQLSYNKGSNVAVFTARLSFADVLPKEPSACAARWMLVFCLG